MLINETVKMDSASTPNNKVEGGYLVIRNPVSKATSRNNMVTRNDRNLHLWLGYYEVAFECREPSGDKAVERREPFGNQEMNILPI